MWEQRHLAKLFQDIALLPQCLQLLETWARHFSGKPLLTACTRVGIKVESSQACIYAEPEELPVRWCSEIALLDTRQIPNDLLTRSSLLPDTLYQLSIPSRAIVLAQFPPFDAYKHDTLQHLEVYHVQERLRV
jgi:hypothetical protein